MGFRGSGFLLVPLPHPGLCALRELLDRHGGLVVERKRERGRHARGRTLTLALALAPGPNPNPSPSPSPWL